jgi:hypothetical protein
VSSGAPFDELICHLCRVSRLRPEEAGKLVAEVLAYFSDSVEAVVRRRHRELKAQGRTNPEIFEQLITELPAWRVVPPTLSERQLRRMIYG